MVIKYVDWIMKIEECLFYYDLRATLDGVECGVINKSFVTQMCKRQGYKFNWKDYSLEIEDVH